MYEESFEVNQAIESEAIKIPRSKLRCRCTFANQFNLNDKVRSIKYLPH
jgi:hypothetical protein